MSPLLVSAYISQVEKLLLRFWQMDSFYLRIICMRTRGTFTFHIVQKKAQWPSSNCECKKSKKGCATVAPLFRSKRIAFEWPLPRRMNISYVRSRMLSGRAWWEIPKSFDAPASNGLLYLPSSLPPTHRFGIRVYVHLYNTYSSRFSFIKFQHCLVNYM